MKEELFATWMVSVTPVEVTSLRGTIELTEVAGRCPPNVKKSWDGVVLLEDGMLPEFTAQIIPIIIAINAKAPKNHHNHHKLQGSGQQTEER